MKRLFSLLVIGSAVILSSFAQQSGNGIDDVISALRTGNTSEMAKFIEESLEITLPNKSDSYSKAQATQILKDFFSNNGVKGLEVKHKGDQSGGQFCIGTLQTQSGNFRTTVFMKVKNGKEMLKEIRFQLNE